MGNGSLIFNRHLELKQIIGSDGRVSLENCEIAEKNEQLAIEIVKSMLGMTLVVRDKKFVLTSLELYYGGIGDELQDWHRNFVKPHVDIKTTKAYVQFLRGPRVFLNQDGNGQHKRMDIVLGDEGVALSALIRNIADENEILLGGLQGAPNSILTKMGITDADFGKEMSRDSGIYLLESPLATVKKPFAIDIGLRKKGPKGVIFNCHMGDKKWNFSISKLFKRKPKR